MGNMSNKDEPRIDGQSIESEYAIKHPLVGRHTPSRNTARALVLFSESVIHLQNGDSWKASITFNKALEADPSLHLHAREALMDMVHSCCIEDEGAIYYWLGIHSQYLEDDRQAVIWYTKAALSFHKLGYQEREGRAHCNLGRVKMKLGDPSGLEEFKEAVALNPRDGIAHIDIGIYYYLADEHEKALDAFSEAIYADPDRYSPVVLSQLQRYGYNWNEDMIKIGQRIAKKLGMDVDKITIGEREGILQATKYYEIGYRYFQSGRYKEALEQYEEGKLLSNKFPGNFFGVSMTAMQMIELGAISTEQIPDYLKMAEQNIEQCLRISPTHREYQNVMIIIGEYKKKYHVV